MIRLVETIYTFLAGNCDSKIPCSSDFYMNTVTPSFSFCFNCSVIFLELVSITVRRDKCLCCSYVRFSPARCILWRINPYRICIYIQQHAKCVYISLQLEEKVWNSPPPPNSSPFYVWMGGFQHVLTTKDFSSYEYNAELSMGSVHDLH
jgi:hypothetical protein